MTDPQDYNDALLDKIMHWRSLPNYADSAVRYLAEAELNPGAEEVFLRKAEVLSLMEIWRLLGHISQNRS